MAKNFIPVIRINPDRILKSLDEEKSDYLRIRLTPTLKHALKNTAYRVQLRSSVLTRNIITKFLTLTEEEQAKFLFG